MPLEVQPIFCPNCGGSLNINNPGRSKILVCQYCSSQIDLTQPPFQAMGLVGDRPEGVVTPFKLGMQGTIGGVTYQIIGRIRYIDTGEEFAGTSYDGDEDDDEDEGSDIWDEWLLLSSEGAYRWISDSEDVGLVLWEPFTPTAPVDPASIYRGANLDLGEGTAARVRSRGSATIQYLEGELTWKAALGDKMNYAEAVNQGGLYSVEWTPNEIEFFRGQKLDRAETERAFGIVRATPAGGGKRSTTSNLVLVAVVVVVVLCLCMAMSWSDGGGGSGGFVSTGSPGRSYGGGGGGSSGGGGGGGGK
jgi:hypothetical protein